MNDITDLIKTIETAARGEEVRDALIQAMKLLQADQDDIGGVKDDLYQKMDSKQDKLEFDETPAAGSKNPVTSSGIKKAIESFNPTITLNFAFDTSTDQLTAENSYDSKANIFRVLKNRIENHAVFDVGYHESDPPLGNDIQMKLYLVDYTSARFSFASVPYDGVVVRIDVLSDNSMQRTAVQYEMKEVAV